MKTFKLDPRIFISPPYIKCPKCGKQSFGILMIYAHHYCRRCKECLYPRGNEPPASYSLPTLNKKIIYIDQFAISNMMKALNPKTKIYQKRTLDEFWRRLFERLDRLCKMQLIICPTSSFHTDESLLSPYFEPLKRMYELLSYGITFYDHITIKRFQIYEHAKNWITGNENKELNLDMHSVMHGEINAWQGILTISLNLQYGKDWIDNLRKSRKRNHEGFSKIFSQWQTEKDKTFDEWFKEESMEFGRATLQIYLNYLNKIEEIYRGRSTLSINDLLPSPSAILIHIIHDVFRESGIPEQDLWSKTVEYLTSSFLKDVPFIKISSMLFAAIARKAASGKREPPNQGMINDIVIISVLLPYCDAMFIDKECHSYLKEKPLCYAIDYGTKIYSLNNKEEFLEYLSEIEMNVSKEHLDKLDEVYGKAWQKPYTTLYMEQK